MKPITMHDLKIKVYADGANLQAILEGSQNPLIKGFTTNPTLLRKAGVHDVADFAREVLLAEKSKPVSFEVFADDLDEMHRQALQINTWGENVYVKIPVSNTKRVSCLPLIRELSKSGVKVNVTAILSLAQTEKVVGALEGGAASVVSVFAGRIADAGVDPVPLMTQAKKMCVQGGPQMELLWASPREIFNVVQADQIGCDIITMTPDLINKLSLLGKDLEDFSLETVQMFYRDAVAAGYQL